MKRRDRSLAARTGLARRTRSQGLCARRPEPGTRRSIPSHLIPSRPIPSRALGRPSGAPIPNPNSSPNPPRPAALAQWARGAPVHICIFVHLHVCIFICLFAYCPGHKGGRARRRQCWALLRCPVRSCACAPHFCAVIISFKEKTALTYLLLNFVIFFLFFFSRRNLRAAGRRDVEEGFGGRRVPLAALRACSGR